MLRAQGQCSQEMNFYKMPGPIVRHAAYVYVFSSLNTDQNRTAYFWSEPKAEVVAIAPEHEAYIQIILAKVGRGFFNCRLYPPTTLPMFAQHEQPCARKWASGLEYN